MTAVAHQKKPPRQVSKRELNQNTASVLAMVDDNTDVIITERGEPKWRISLDKDPPISYLERLELAGLITPHNPHPLPWPEQAGGPDYTRQEVIDLLDDIRGDR